MIKDVDSEVSLVAWLVESSMRGHAGFEFDEKNEVIRGQMKIRAGDIFRFIPRTKKTDPYQLPYYIGVPRNLAHIFGDIQWGDVLVYEDVMLLTAKVAMHNSGDPRVQFELGIPINVSILNALQAGYKSVSEKIAKYGDGTIDIGHVNLDFCQYDTDNKDANSILIASMKPIKSMLFKFTYRSCFRRGEMGALSHKKLERI